MRRRDEMLIVVSRYVPGDVASLVPPGAVFAFASGFDAGFQVGEA